MLLPLLPPLLPLLPLLLPLLLQQLPPLTPWQQLWYSSSASNNTNKQYDCPPSGEYHKTGA